MKKLKISIVAVLLVVASWLVGSQITPKTVPLGGITSSECSPDVVTALTIGNQLSSRLVATSSRRAWARIQLPANATNTVTLSFNNDVTATSGNGLQLNVGQANGSSSVQYIDFGLNTVYPYVGSVQGLTSTGSTTVLYTSCRY